jgi:hypothetical protein
MKRIRFCVYQYANRPLPELAQRWKRAEELEFDVLWNCDALNEPDHPGMIMFEASSILTAMALHTSRIRVGTLVNTLIYRNPAIVAKTAMTIDHVSRAVAWSSDSAGAFWPAITPPPASPGGRRLSASPASARRCDSSTNCSATR